MPINVSDLPLEYQAQAARKYVEQQKRKEKSKSAVLPQEVGKGAKYRNTPTERVTKSGAILHFDSKKEARRFDTLAARQAAGQIRDLRLQVDFTLQEAFTDTGGNRVRAIRYKADFTYWERETPDYLVAEGWPCDGWHYVVEDVKSEATRTAQYAMKKKMMKERFGHDITEV